jgi:hypothetical protein
MTAVVLREIIAKFDDFDAFKRALGSLQAVQTLDYEAYGPTNLGELALLMSDRARFPLGPGVRPILGNLKDTFAEILTGQRVSPVRGIATIGAIIGLVGFSYMAIATSLIYKVIVGGKLPVANVPYVVLAYEGTILIGALGAFIAVLYYARLNPNRRPAPEYDPSFSEDTYGVRVSCAPEQVESTMALLRNAGAVEVYER